MSLVEDPEIARCIFREAIDGYLLIDPADLRVLDANPAALRLTGYRRKEILQLGMTDLLDGPDDAAARVLLEGVQSTSRAGVLPGYWLRGAGGRRVPVQVTASRVHAEPATLGLLIVRDVRGLPNVVLPEDEGRVRDLFTVSPDAIVVEALDGTILDVNARACQMHGLPRERLVGRNGLDMVPAEVRASFDRLASGEVTFVEGVSRAADGRDIPVEVRLSRVTYLGRPARLLHVRDVSPRKLAEQSLRESQRFIERVAEASPHIIYVFDLPSQKNIYANRQMGRDLGYSADEVQAMGDEFLPRLLHPEDLGRLPELLRRWDAARDGEVFETHYRMRHRDGSWRWFVGRDTVFSRGPDGRVTRFVGTAEDVTARKLAEQEVLDSKRMLELVMNNIPQGVFWKDRDSRYLGCNRVVAERHGLAGPSEIVGRTYAGLPSVTAEQAASFVAKDRQVIESGTPEHGIEERMTLADGSTVWLETCKMPMLDAAGRVVGVVGTWQDVTERRRAEQALRASEYRYLTTLASIGDAVVATDAAGRITYLNPVAEALTGWPRAEAAGRPLDEALPLRDERSRQPVENPAGQVLRLRAAVGLANGVVLVTRDGREVPIEDSAAPIRGGDGEVEGVVLVFRDVTAKRQSEEQRRRLEAQLLHAQKLESLGVLAGGIAHDFNNLLTGILGYTNLAGMSLPADSTARPLLSEAEKTANRASDLVRQLLAYAGKGRFLIQPIDLNALTAEMLGLLRTLVSRKAQVRTDFAEGLPPVEADATQVRQVVMNLITNASEALGGGEGEIALRTGVERVEDPAGYSTHAAPEARPGDYVFVEVSDTGCGMSEETLARVFDPFFSTKFSGRGLGLAAVLGIVRGHRGIVRLSSAVGEGTRFRVLFPRAEAALPEPAPAEARSVTAAGTGSVLVVDDEEAVRSLAAHVLRDAGYQVVVAGDGEEGLAAFRVAGTKIRAVVMDLTMPGIDGLEATRRLYELRPDVPVILMSGYGEPQVMASLAGTRFAGFLQKPFIGQVLLAALREAIERSG